MGRPKLTRGMDITDTATGLTVMATTGTDHTATATTERDLLMRVPPNLALTLMPKLTRGMVTTAMVTGLTDMATTVTDTIMERDLLMRSPNLAPTLMPKLTPGMVTTAMVTGLTVMATTGTDPTVMLTGDKKWTSI